METGTAAVEGKKEHTGGGKGRKEALEIDTHKKENTGEVIKMMCK